MNLAGAVGADSPSPRAYRRALTDEFARDWSEVEAPLRRYLAALGDARTDIDDVVQETALRAMTSGVVYSDPQDLRRWCFQVAKRIRIDSWRRRSNHTQVLADRHDPRADDLMSQVEDRHLIATVLREVAALRPIDRQAVMPGPTPGDAVERNRAAVARHRARQRLLRAVGPIATAAGWFATTARALRRGAARYSAAAAMPALVAVAFAAMPVWIHGPASSGNQSAALNAGDGYIDLRLLQEPDAARGHAGVESRPGRPASAHSLAPAATTIASANGPAGAAAYARLSRNNPDRPMLCVAPRVAPETCLAKPSVPPTPAPDGPDAAHHRLEATDSW